jgi:hypothetical protein
MRLTTSLPDGPPVQLVNYAVGTQLHAELRSVLLFLETADRLGLATPLDYDEFVAGHDPIVQRVLMGARIQRQGGQLIQMTAQETEELTDSLQCFPLRATLPSFALAQHYGIPTRLLDWSESPLVAAYFAACSVLDAPVVAHDSDLIGVFVLDTDVLRKMRHDKNPTTVELVMAPRHANANLRSQRGTFTYTPSANAFFREKHQWPSVVDSLGSAYGHALSLLTLPRTEAEELLRLLWNFQIKRHHLMPSLDTAAQAMDHMSRLFPFWN